jgi:hypothetical protein
MPAGTFYIKQHDRLPSLQATLLDGNGQPINLTGATVTFTMVNAAGSVIVNDAAATVVNATAGVVAYAWGVSDTTNSGTFYGEFEVTSGGLVERFPNDGNITIIITAAIG